jgi:hypothetical protein
MMLARVRYVSRSGFPVFKSREELPENLEVGDTFDRLSSWMNVARDTTDVPSNFSIQVTEIEPPCAAGELPTYSLRQLE